MFFPEFLYRLSERDQQVTWLDPFIFEQGVSVAGTTPNTTVSSVPLDRALVVQSATVVGIPGAGQACTFLRMTVRAPLGNQSIRLFQQGFAVAANVQQAINWQGSILIPPLWSLTVESVFDAGVAVNQIVGGIWGILIPVGNVQRV